MMKLGVSVFLTIISLCHLALGSQVTFVLGAQDRECYYVFNNKPGTNIGYYFAVQSGGSFDVDYQIKAPNGKIIVKENKQRQGDWVFNADQNGEYEFCFSNGMSTFAEKVVDFEIKLEDDDFRAALPNAPSQQVATDEIHRTINSLEEKLQTLTRDYQYYKTRNNRNQSTVKSTESRIFYFSIFDVLLMCGMAGFQVAVVQLFFKGSRKQLV
ncbi:BA75_03860T0 [Komagataella pastoris]|uniref:BA75_03860T0 n=1 Tax=Komagataella pastoris TaxID=4922 RepID=A0A1B2JEB8_PICPA|nr:BA75_03860T0 [Komagataella pastoris]